MCTKYDYLEAMTADVLDYIEENIDLTEYADAEELESFLNDELWTADSVTGNASGSYYCNAYKAEEVNMNSNERLAHEFIEAIKAMAEKPDNMDNFECYLSHHFDAWMGKYAYNPESLTSEVKHFAEMEI